MGYANPRINNVHRKPQCTKLNMKFLCRTNNDLQSNLIQVYFTHLKLLPYQQLHDLKLLRPFQLLSSILVAEHIEQYLFHT